MCHNIPFTDMYNVKLYINTGFDAINIPESVSVLEASATSTLTLPSIDIYSQYDLSSIEVHVNNTNRDEAILADFCQIDDAYYAVTGYTFTSYDVVSLNLYFEAYLSARAKGAISSIGGQTVRRRVAESEDTFGRFTENDPLMAPQKPLQLEVGDPLFTADTDYDWVVINSSIDLKDLQDKAVNGGLEGKTFSDGSNSVTVPSVLPVSTPTSYLSGEKSISNDGNALYKSREVQNAVGLARSLGVESAILKQFRLPVNLITIDLSNITTDGSPIPTVTGKDESVSSKINLAYTTVRNKKLLYGQYNKCGLITASGNSSEFNPEEIASSETESPEVRVRVDPRPDGAPYFRFKTVNGDSSDTGFWRNAIKGLGWQNAPLRYTTPSNSYLDTYNFTSEREQSIGSFYAGQAMQGIQNKADLVTGVAGGIISTATGDIGKGVSGVAGSVFDYAIKETKRNIDQTFFEQSKQRELYNFGYSQSVVVPEINFPLNADIIRDTIGNSVVPYKYRYSNEDIKRIDTLLTMYGYAEVEPFKVSMLQTHKDFEYLQLQGVSIKADNIPMWWRNRVADELNTGIRIWHVKPDFGYYDGSKTVGA